MKKLLLILWIPMTISVLLHIYFLVVWQFFGIITGINPLYTSRFSNSWEFILYFVNEIGYFGGVLFIIIAIAYAYLTRRVFTKDLSLHNNY